MSGPHAPTDKAAFNAWLEADLSHEIAYEQEFATWRQLGHLGEVRSAGHAVDERIGDARSPAPPRSAPTARFGRRAFIGGALAAASAGAAVLILDGGAKAYATETGERRKIRLDRGGTVELNTETRLTVRDGRGACRVEVAAGEAMFDLVGGAGRAFEVRAGDVALRGTGARFSLRRHDAATRVMVLDGELDLSGADRPLRLTGGDIADVGLGRAVSHRAATDELNRGLSWREGRIILSGETLAEAAAEFNRYNSRRIVIADPAVGAVSVGGSFDADKPADFVRAVEASFGVRAVETPSGFRLVRGG
jgi:transmembrane sensor